MVLGGLLGSGGSDDTSVEDAINEGKDQVEELDESKEQWGPSEDESDSQELESDSMVAAKVQKLESQLEK